MAKSDEYRAKAEECRRMAGKVSTAIDQAAWLGLATAWLGLIRDPARTTFERFDAMERVRGTHQQNSSAEHPPPSLRTINAPSKSGAENRR
jgi:hypothetical protein